jgi:hypothetical protein
MDSLLLELVGYIMGFLPNQTPLAWTCKVFLSLLTKLECIHYSDGDCTYLTYEPYNSNKITYLETDCLRGSFNSLKILELTYDGNKGFGKLHITLPNLISLTSEYCDINLVSPNLEIVYINGGSINGKFMKLKELYLSEPKDMSLKAHMLDCLYIMLFSFYRHDPVIISTLTLDIYSVKRMCCCEEFELILVENDFKKPDGFKESEYWKTLYVIEERWCPFADDNQLY